MSPVHYKYCCRGVLINDPHEAGQLHRTASIGAGLPAVLCLQPANQLSHMPPRPAAPSNHLLPTSLPPFFSQLFFPHPHLVVRHVAAARLQRWRKRKAVQASCRGLWQWWLWLGFPTLLG